jgi:hypothetical protein
MYTRADACMHMYKRAHNVSYLILPILWSGRYCRYPCFIDEDIKKNHVPIFCQRCDRIQIVLVPLLNWGRSISLLIKSRIVGTIDREWLELCIRTSQNFAKQKWSFSFYIILTMYLNSMYHRTEARMGVSICHNITWRLLYRRP